MGENTYSVRVTQGGYGETNISTKYNGGEISDPLDSNLREVIDHLAFEHIRLLHNNPKMKTIETIISGDFLK